MKGKRHTREREKRKHIPCCAMPFISSSESAELLLALGIQNTQQSSILISFFFKQLFFSPHDLRLLTHKFKAAQWSMWEIDFTWANIQTNLIAIRFRPQQSESNCTYITCTFSSARSDLENGLWKIKVSRRNWILAELEREILYVLNFINFNISFRKCQGECV